MRSAGWSHGRHRMAPFVVLQYNSFIKVTHKHRALRICDPRLPDFACIYEAKLHADLHGWKQPLKQFLLNIFTSSLDLEHSESSLQQMCTLMLVYIIMSENEWM
jgi:hypothetical protein